MSKPTAIKNSTYICVDVDSKLLTFFQGSAIEKMYVKPFLKLNGFSVVTMDYEVEWQRVILTKIREIYELYTQKSFGYEIDICINLASVWRILITNENENIPKTSINTYIDEQRIKTIMTYIHEHYMEKITLDNIAAVANISKGECCRFFKRMVQGTVFEYIAKYRINKSIELLLSTDMTVSEIADLTGFGSTSYYIENFKKQILCTPKEYRSQN